MIDMWFTIFLVSTYRQLFWHVTLLNAVFEATSSGSVNLCVIDFGLGYVEGSVEDKGVDLYVLERALISTHPFAEFMFDEILNTYKSEMKDKKSRQEIVRKYEEIRMRGRKRDMLG